MNHYQPCSEATLSLRRTAFCSCVARARLAPACQRDDILADAATIARLHYALTGSPLLTDVADQLCAVSAGWCVRCGLRPAEDGTCAIGQAAPCPTPRDPDDQTASLPPIALDAAHLAIWLHHEAG